MVLVLDENELVKSLSAELLQKAIGRGKGYQRAKAVEKRQAAGFNQWRLYETLKGDRTIDDVTIKAVEAMPTSELREGIIEYLLMKRRTRDE